MAPVQRSPGFQKTYSSVMGQEQLHRFAAEPLAISRQQRPIVAERLQQQRERRLEVIGYQEHHRGHLETVGYQGQSGLASVGVPLAMEEQIGDRW